MPTHYHKNLLENMRKSVAYAPQALVKGSIYITIVEVIIYGFMLIRLLS